MASTPQNIEDILLSEDGIRLGQLLKLMNAVEDGQEAKAVISDGLVQVNGDIETRRGCQLHAGDVIAFNGGGWRITVDA
ncbi:RNA-binding S4 domain-containing protein [Galactobacter caseinivorans]|uniref:RNA-binding S4 domain-containing protein n=1 Tax=Galactobacter caseinivorans TaxID=2676123 RepID=UPI0018F5BCE9|nr:RNA-binding S4 domain-containing protein [Galactobacter caseinivorans]